MLDRFLIEDTLKYALKEDMNNGDVTSDYLLDNSLTGKATITAKEQGVLCGLDIAEMVFLIVDDHLKITKLKKDGQKLEKGEDIAVIEGRLKNILKSERVALNFLQRMSGISTQANQISSIVKDLNVKVVDTRKTTPGLRVFEKYAVKTGGCSNHRFNLSDAAMIKDNHIEAVGSITEAVEILRSQLAHTTKIEVEVKDLDQLKEAIESKADIIMLDNMDIENMKRAVNITDNRAILEASGNISFETIREIAKTGVDIISVGGLTHSFKSIDISLNIN